MHCATLSLSGRTVRDLSFYFQLGDDASKVGTLSKREEFLEHQLANGERFSKPLEGPRGSNLTVTSRYRGGTLQGY
jgi:hypothetical protein